MIKCYNALPSGDSAKAGLIMLATSSWLTIRFLCDDSISSQSTHRCGTRLVSNIGLSVLSHLKVANADVSAWHMAAERNQSMQWSQSTSAAVRSKEANFPYQCEPQDAGDREPSCLGGSALCSSTVGAFSASCQRIRPWPGDNQEPRLTTQCSSWNTPSQAR